MRAHVSEPRAVSEIQGWKTVGLAMEAKRYSKGGWGNLNSTCHAQEQAVNDLVLISFFSGLEWAVEAEPWMLGDLRG
ncbi:MAG: hypothetical protein IPK73_26455 [Candidatus Obscuribacter sp.]|nr:hypothetical protein [Candidatus Obscuribacter sp.]HMX47321.1 hypothetical protein [Candidatus Obscuribacter sp.]